jgi:hypothetical protein
MKPVDLLLMLSCYLFTASAAAVACASRRRDRRSWALAALVLALIPLNSYAGFRIDPNLDYLGLLAYLIRERDVSSVIAIGMGFAAGLTWIPRSVRSFRPLPRESWRDSLEMAFLGVSAVLMIGAGQAFLWKDIRGYTRYPAAMLAAGFELSKIADLDEQPLRLAVDQDSSDVYICYDYFRKHGAMGGTILRLRQDANGQYSRRTVVEAPFLIRPYGLAIRKGDLYVSRAGFSPQANSGSVHYESTGAVTQLKDLDGDGYFEFSHDVVRNLPGVRAPDTMQQNNGLVFSDDGHLYVTNAGAADRTLDEHPWGGTILKVSPDFAQVEVFA